MFTRKDDEDKTFHISAESSGHEKWADYYGPQGYPYENPKIEAVLKPFGLTLEWDNPGSLSIWD